MHGIRRLIVFCILTTVLPTMLLVIPLYLRHSFYANVAYAVTESDILEVTDGVSTIFCSEHSLQMNGTFNAFQMSQKPEITSYRKHIRLKKSMNLPDDTLEYWGFYLLKGATVALSVCSRFQGASILVVKGERNLRTCGMLEHNYHKQVNQGIFIPGANRQVKITFESNAQEINSEEHQSENKSKHEVNPINRVENDDSENLYIVNENSTTSTVVPRTRQDNETLEELFHTAEEYVQKHLRNKTHHADRNTRRIRHAKTRGDKLRIKQGSSYQINRTVHESKRLHPGHKKMKGKKHHTLHSSDTHIRGEHNKRLRKLEKELNYEETERNVAAAQGANLNEDVINHRMKRSQELMKPPSLLDRGILHGGNAGKNLTSAEGASSVSSFENGLFDCYGGSILIAEEFAPSDHCTNVTYLLTGKHMQTKHNVAENGYYYYIFYSDNDFVSNDIHALFDIYKPTFQYENVTKSCINQTECSFSLSFLSADRVIVEIPTRNGIEHELDDTALLISICHPRMGIYMIFPIAVLFFIISCAFM